mgnify:CR=1 FL=1
MIDTDISEPTCYINSMRVICPHCANPSWPKAVELDLVDGYEVQGGESFGVYKCEKCGIEIHIGVIIESWGE